MQLRSSTTEDPEISLTGLIDVVFLLLIFFMVSTTFEHHALLKVDLPLQLILYPAHRKFCH